jgi:phosphoglycolate phosphatase-like HAD superfamily hydrolase
VRASFVPGDRVWDLLTARRAKTVGVGVLAGGYRQHEFERVRAYRVYQDLFDLLNHVDELGVRAAV